MISSVRSFLYEGYDTFYMVRDGAQNKDNEYSDSMRTIGRNPIKNKE